MFCIYLITNSDLCHLCHKVIDFLTEMKSVYSAVLTGDINKTISPFAFKGLIIVIKVHLYDVSDKYNWADTRRQ
jgi:hypothetical protein